jgi:hypothetical protein
VAGSLPCESTSFVGRSAELAAVARLLADPGCRLLTLLGSGGIGKTQLALAVAAAHTATFADGVAFVALASVGSPDQIVSAIGESLQLDFASQPDPTTHLLGELRERTPLIVERRERQLRLPRSESAVSSFSHMFDYVLCNVQGSWYHESDYTPSWMHHYQIALCVYFMPRDWRCQSIAWYFLVHRLHLSSPGG